MQTEIPIVRIEGEAARETRDVVAIEEPLEIRLNGESLTVTMRTPGDDFDLVAGFLLAEGIVRSGADIRFMGYGAEANAPERANIVNVRLAENWQEQQTATHWERKFAISSSCGVCGKMTLAAVRCTALALEDGEIRVPIATLKRLPERMREAQRGFARTGGLHAAGLFDREGGLLTLREDVGRHNAVDKVIGAETRRGQLPLSAHLLLVSGRLSFEIVQKAAMARIPLLCAVSAPSSLAVELARDLNMTLVGFLRGETMNIYTGAERLRLPCSAP